MTDRHKPQLQFRCATPKDAEMLARMRVQVLEDRIYEAPVEKNKRDRLVNEHKSDFGYELENGEDRHSDDVHTHAIIASVNGEALGYIMYRQMNDKTKVIDLYVQDHDILSDDKKLEVGQALHKKMVLLEQNTNMVNLCAFDKAVGFYQKMGYQELPSNSKMIDMMLLKDDLNAWHLTALSGRKRPNFES